MISAWYAGYYFANSNFFDLSEIRVTGNVVVNRDEIIALSGLRVGTNILRITPEEVAANVRSQPYVKEAVVSRSLPNKIEIRVSERSPMVLISGDGRHLVLDEYGYCMAEVGIVAAESWTLPRIRCSEEAAALSPGERSTDKGVQAAIALIKELDLFFLENVSEIDAITVERLAVINTDGLRVYFGPPEALDRKLQNYEELLIKNRDRCNADTLNYVDLRYDTQITLSWK